MPAVLALLRNPPPRGFRKTIRNNLHGRMKMIIFSLSSTFAIIIKFKKTKQKRKETRQKKSITLPKRPCKFFTAY